MNDRVGSLDFVVCEALSPGPPTRWPTLHRGSHLTRRKAWLLRVELFLRQDLFGRICDLLTCFLLPVFIGAPFTFTATATADGYGYGYGYSR